MEKESDERNLIVGSDKAIIEEVNLLDEMDFTEKCAVLKKEFNECLKRASPEDMKQMHAYFNKVLHEKSVIQCRVKTKRIPSTGEFLPKKSKQSDKQANGDNNEKQNIK